MSDEDSGTAAATATAPQTTAAPGGEALIQQNVYKAPWLPGHVAALVVYSPFWLVPYWIIEFLVFFSKSHLLQDGVAPEDWFFLFAWLLVASLAHFCACRAIRRGDWVLSSPIWVFIGLTILGCFISIWIGMLARTILRVEQIISIITFIIQAILGVLTVASVAVASSAAAADLND
jgi:hypothetical protein